MSPIAVKNFYNRHPFPGPYTIEQLKNYSIESNKYVKIFDRYLDNGLSVLDIGCGTGMLTNLFALNYSSNFLGVDFSRGADYARKFAAKNSIKNSKFYWDDFFHLAQDKTFDRIICQSFLTHVPDYVGAIEKIKQHTNPGGIICVSIYNRYGKIVQKLFGAKYRNSRLQLDQESNPYDNTFTHQEFLDLWQGYDLLEVTPSKFVNFSNLFNAKNGGLTLYVFRKPL